MMILGVRDMANLALLTVRAPPGVAERIVVDSFAVNGFTLTWADAWSGRAEKGNRNSSFFNRASGEYVALDFTLSPGKDACVLRLEKPSGGVAGGLLFGGAGLGYAMGAKNQQFVKTVDMFRAHFSNRGVVWPVHATLMIGATCVPIWEVL